MIKTTFLFKITIEYNGVYYFGWQKQKGFKTVQSTIEMAIAKITGDRVNLYSASRTDAKVHALGQVAHFQITKQFEENRLRSALNYFLCAKKIVITKVKKMNVKFHARYSNKVKTYQYKILNRCYPSVLYQDLAWHIKKPLDIFNMQKASESLIGKHNFSSFRAKGCQAKSPVITLNKIKIRKIVNNIIIIDFEAASFLYKQIRIIVGTLVEFGLGRYHYILMKHFLAKKNRNSVGITAPGHGLYLKKIKYL